MSQIAQTHSRVGRRSLPALAIAASALFVLATATQAAAGIVDLRSPDARDAARAAHTTTVVDLRSPDARDATRAAHAPTVVDLRSPDARDAGRAIRPIPTSSGQPSGGFEWGYLAIGGGALILLLGAGGAVRRRARPKHPPVAVES